MKLFYLFAACFLCSKMDAQIFMAKSGATNINFFSAAPLENIEATNKGAIIVLKASSGDIQVRVTMRNFKFKNALMEEHFNENYMETDKKVTVEGATTYPNKYGEFLGKINEPIDYAKEGETKVTITGKMNIHGVINDITIDGTFTKKGKNYDIAAKFPIRVADYNIKVPTMYVKNIAEVVDVTISSTLEPYVKK